MALEELTVRCAECGTKLSVVSVLVVHNTKMILNVASCPECVLKGYELGIKEGGPK